MANVPVGLLLLCSWCDVHLSIYGGDCSDVCEVFDWYWYMHVLMQLLLTTQKLFGETYIYHAPDAACCFNAMLEVSNKFMHKWTLELFLVQYNPGEIFSKNKDLVDLLWSCSLLETYTRIWNSYRPLYSYCLRLNKMSCLAIRIILFYYFKTLVVEKEWLVIFLIVNDFKPCSIFNKERTPYFLTCTHSPSLLGSGPTNSSDCSVLLPSPISWRC